jgi:hypothetical protein
MSAFAKSPWILHYAATSCNGCDIEVLACLTPVYDVERFGVQLRRELGPGQRLPPGLQRGLDRTLGLVDGGAAALLLSR